VKAKFWNTERGRLGNQHHSEYKIINDGKDCHMAKIDKDSRLQRYLVSPA